MNYTNKLKIFNDPIYGFVQIPNSIVYDLVEHPVFQRLRYIKQTGFSSIVYPGANHTRFHHALGCLHLMQKAINCLKQKNIEITKEEEQAVYIAILLHDVGHGPFSHALESVIAENIHHEMISLQLMEQLNQDFKGELELAIKIFNKQYHKNFLSQLIASQLDIDRLDYLKRDSFYTGVSEGNINSDRLITMMNVADDNLVIEAKGIYSVEKLLTSRMFMYWQVYLHKTSVSAENYLVQIMKRAKELVQKGEKVEASKALDYFLTKTHTELSSKDLEIFTLLDDHDMMMAIKNWQYHEDKTLSVLSKMLIQRRLPTSLISKEKQTETILTSYKNRVEEELKIENADYFVHQTCLELELYNPIDSPIFLKYKEGMVVNLSESEHQAMTLFLQQPIKKYHICYLNESKLKEIKQFYK
jgi:uncharacterized protein